MRGEKGTVCPGICLGCANHRGQHRESPPHSCPHLSHPTRGHNNHSVGLGPIRARINLGEGRLRAAKQFSNPYQGQVSGLCWMPATNPAAQCYPEMPGTHVSSSTHDCPRLCSSGLQPRLSLVHLVNSASPLFSLQLCPSHLPRAGAGSIMLRVTEASGMS